MQHLLGKTQRIFEVKWRNIHCLKLVGQNLRWVVFLMDSGCWSRDCCHRGSHLSQELDSRDEHAKLFEWHVTLQMLEFAFSATLRHCTPHSVLVTTMSNALSKAISQCQFSIEYYEYCCYAPFNYQQMKNTGRENDKALIYLQNIEKRLLDDVATATTVTTIVYFHYCLCLPLISMYFGSFVDFH